MNFTTDCQVEENIASWLEKGFDKQTKKEIQRLQKESPQELADAFGDKLAFGTGGLRGIMGTGPNRMNLYTIRAASQAFSNHLISHSAPSCTLSLIVGFDNRHNSRAFAEEAAAVFAANGIQVYLFHHLRPTPLISFACRYKKCDGAVMITASHNPPIYNGYKLYGRDGAQVVSPDDRKIIEAFYAIKDWSQIAAVSFDHPLIQRVDREIDEAYIKEVHALQYCVGENRSEGSCLRIRYSCLHGTGESLMLPTLHSWGFTHTEVVKEQSVPDGNFSTLHCSPNPEDPEALKIGIQQMVEHGNDLFIATDPDADRLGLVVLHREKPVILNGNQICALLAEHICRMEEKKRSLESNSAAFRKAIVKTIVTTEMLSAIADRYDVTCFNVLTGFKYIGELIRQWELGSNLPKNQRHRFLFGGEESYGYLVGTHARDKDAIISGAFICEIALQAKKTGKTLVDVLHELYEEYGIYREHLYNQLFSTGSEGKKEIDGMMKRVRKKIERGELSSIASLPVREVEDYQTSVKKNMQTGEESPLHLPQSNVLRFLLKEGSQLIIRPSGTEPKVKIYGGSALHPPFSSIEEGIIQCDEKVESLLHAMKSILLQ